MEANFYHSSFLPQDLDKLVTNYEASPTDDNLNSIKSFIESNSVIFNDLNTDAIENLKSRLISKNEKLQNSDLIQNINRLVANRLKGEEIPETSIENIPIEILSYILSYTQDGSKTASVSKEWHEATQLSAKEILDAAEQHPSLQPYINAARNTTRDEGPAADLQRLNYLYTSIMQQAEEAGLETKSAPSISDLVHLVDKFYPALPLFFKGAITGITKFSDDLMEELNNEDIESFTTFTRYLNELDTDLPDNELAGYIREWMAENPQVISQLKTLAIEENNLERLPDELTDFSGLEVLIINANLKNFSDSAEVLNSLDKLAYIKLENENAIPEKEFEALNSLELTNSSISSQGKHVYELARKE